MPTTDIPLKARAAETASRCGSPLRALRLLREAKERTHSLSENLGQGVGTAEVEPPAWAAPPPPGPPPSLHCGSPPPTGSYCGLRLRARPREARATGRLRLGGLALGRSRQRSATARCGVAGSRKSWKEGGEAAEPRGRAGRDGAGQRSGDAWGGGRSRLPATPGQRCLADALLSAALLAAPPSSALLSAAPLALAARILPGSPRATAWDLTAGLAAPRGRPRAARAEAPPAAPLWGGAHCAVPGSPASQSYPAAPGPNLSPSSMKKWFSRPWPACPGSFREEACLVRRRAACVHLNKF